MKRFIDRRQHRRYKAREGSLAALLPAFSQLGEIENISRGGLSFKYYVTNDRYLKEDYASMNILFNDDLCLEKVAFRIIADCEQESDLPPPIRTRKCRIQFNRLSKHQLHALDEFIKIHTLGDAGDRRSADERRIQPLPQSNDFHGYDRRVDEERRRRKLKVITFY